MSFRSGLLRPLAFTLVVMPAACTFDVDTPDAVGGGKTGVKSANLDDHTVEGIGFSAGDAARAVNLVNHASLRTLDHDVGLDRRAASQIVAHRPIGTLDDLANVPRVGKSAIRKIHDYVARHSDADVAALPAQCSATGLATPGPRFATDARAPEVGDDVSIIGNARISLADAVKQLQGESGASGAVIEAKYELDDSGALSLSIYPVDGLDKDAERTTFKEAAGNPGELPFTPGMETFTDREHLVRSARDLTLVELSQIGVMDAAVDVGDFVYWSVPTIQWGRAGYGVYSMDPFDCESTFTFVDGLGSDESNWWAPEDLGNGPGIAATDARTPELADDLTVVRQSRISMADAVAQVEAANGPIIEAKFELGDDGKLSLSLYPVADLDHDPENTTFVEAAGDPTAPSFAPALTTFADDDVEHQTRSARDLTLVQTASLSLADAVWAADEALPGGVVFWAIPTIRDTRAGYGVYVLAADDSVHYFFID